MLLLVSTAIIVAVLLFRAIQFRVGGLKNRAFRSFRTAVIFGVGYMFALVVVSMTSHPRELSTGDLQCFGDWCVTVTRAQLSNGRGVVKLSLQNQGTRAQLRPEQPVICVLDPKGRRIAPRAESGPPLGRALKPGETVTKEYQFDIPRDMQYPMLWITEGGWITRFLIGGGNSFLHPKQVTLLQ